ncbi:MAG: AAA family ATPase [Kineosporiaceae bacterium]|nr:AAA family ATPase [Kineosporiaceae bacterium]
MSAGEGSIDATVVDPRAVLADWANRNDEWVRFIVKQVLTLGRPLAPEDADYAYRLFRQEKLLDARALPPEPHLENVLSREEAELPLAITKLWGVAGVNALVPGMTVEPHAGLTILFGENGTGKTGYSRIFKALANSRTADVILGDVTTQTESPQSAHIEYTLGSEKHVFEWKGEHGKAPFTRMSIFDSPSVTFHVDDDLDYVYVPAALALFNHAIAGIKLVQSSIDASVAELKSGTSTLLSRFPRDSSVYTLVETLGASTDLEALRAKIDADPKVDERIEALRMAVAALEANTLENQISLYQRSERVLKQAQAAATTLSLLESAKYGGLLRRRADLRKDYETFRVELFRAADLPAEPDATWEAFVSSGEGYRNHLSELGKHDADRCLYCRQTLSEEAMGLIGKYGEYLADKISSDISSATTQINEIVTTVRPSDVTEVSTFVKEFEGREDQPLYYEPLVKLTTTFDGVIESLSTGTDLSVTLDEDVSPLITEISGALATVSTELGSLRDQASNRTQALSTRKKELTELVASSELSKSWATIETQVKNAKEADRLKILARALPTLSRNVTDLSKTASDQMINQSFDKLFVEECTALRAPSLKLQFVGREGRAQRRKVLSGRHKPSKVLSEGEQKVLAMADFLAEARLAGITAPVIFDDPVSSLDHRRINEVARRVALLAENNQVIVFTHDIFFATTLLSLFEKSKRCTYFQVTDDEGKGKVTRATGPRWDTLASLRKNINETIQSAKLVDGEARAALVRTGYDWIRSWCEVFTETELLQGVTQRYQPNVRMTSLPNIKIGALPTSVAIVTRIFEEACRYIDGHSQPLASLGVGPSLPGLEGHWKELQDCKKDYDSSAA